MKNILLLLISLVVLISHARANAAESPRDPTKVYLPPFASGVRYPLVLLLHGYMGDQDLINTYFGYGDQVEARKFILLIPNGLKDHSGLRYWNASAACCDFDHRANDDVVYLKSVLNEAIARYPVDPKRIFVVGHSNGGFMAHRMACEFSETVTGVISFAGAGPLNAQNCGPTRAVSVLQIHAEDDDTILFKGDEHGYTGLAGYPSAAQTVADWMKRDECKASARSPEKIDLTDDIPGRDTSVTTTQNCKANAAVELWQIEAYKSLIHFPHTPRLTDEFTNRTLDFIFSHPRE